MFTTTNQNQHDNMSYYNGLKPMWVNQPLKGTYIIQNIKFFLSFDY